jgi:hypothetical protein
VGQLRVAQIIRIRGRMKSGTSNRPHILRDMKKDVHPKRYSHTTASRARPHSTYSAFHSHHALNLKPLSFTLYVVNPSFKRMQRGKQYPRTAFVVLNHKRSYIHTVHAYTEANQNLIRIRTIGPEKEIPTLLFWHSNYIFYRSHRFIQFSLNSFREAGQRKACC